ncbi:MAG: hypothetical protein H0V70_07805 [Ktedonobacteraceae bacterium]|nr:hypothetical protein [Ktedonobacteraceae bacterium]
MRVGPGQGLDPEEEAIVQGMADYWQKVWNETPLQTITRLEDAAKQVIAVTAALQGLYLAIFVFSNLRVQLAGIQWVLPTWMLWIVFLLPLACWVISLFFATRVFLPRIRPGVNFNEVSAGAWQKVKDVYRQAAEEKLRWLRYSHGWLVASFVLILLAVILFVCLPTPPTGPTQILIVTPIPSPLPTP